MTLLIPACASVPGSAPQTMAPTVQPFAVPTATPVPCLKTKSIPVLQTATPIDKATATPSQKSAAVDRDYKAMVRHIELTDDILKQCGDAP
jgi:hypothetical protein